jgi:hypothetical protein
MSAIPKSRSFAPTPPPRIFAMKMGASSKGGLS